MKPTTFEAYSLEDICQNSHMFNFLNDDILSDELDICAQGMEYSLIYLNNIIQALNKCMNDDYEQEVLEYLQNWYKQNKCDEQTLVFIQGY
jgi:hypothetical protein